MVDSLLYQNAVPGAGGGARARVLVAEDDPNVAEILAIFFQMEGMETAIARNGNEAVDTAKSFHPHLVCMDLGMPESDGYEAVRRIRQFSRDMVIVALCGRGDHQERQLTAAAGFDLHLVKPVQPDDLRQVIARYLTVLPAPPDTPPDPP